MSESATSTTIQAETNTQALKLVLSRLGGIARWDTRDLTYDYPRIEELLYLAGAIMSGFDSPLRVDMDRVEAMVREIESR